MPSQFQTDKHGEPFILADPDSDLEYSISCWLEGLIFTSAVWVMSPDVPGAMYNFQINSVPVTIDGVTYAVGKLASAWIKGLVAGQTYEITVQATFTGNRRDDRTFNIRCEER